MQNLRSNTLFTRQTSTKASHMGRNIPALVVAHSNILKPDGGGVQVCHREYETSLAAAGFILKTIPFEFSRGIGSRILHRILPTIVSTSEPSDLFQSVESAIRETKAEFIFFAWSVFPSLSLKLRQAFPKVRQVLLSHGVEGLDFCIEQRLRRQLRTENRYRIAAERMLGHQLLYEAEQRQWLDAVLTVSPFEVEIEKWLGACKAFWVPRIITEPRLKSQPVDLRLGCVATLDHTPNANGLVQLFDELEKYESRGFRFRLVGQPTKRGDALARRYTFVDYLGPLSDVQLRLEAATWCCFVHPIFVFAKGYSTKLSIALGWGLPIATTDIGARGYRWDRDKVPLADSPAELVQIVLERSSVQGFEVHQQATGHTASLALKVDEVGHRIREFLGLVEFLRLNSHK